MRVRITHFAEAELEQIGLFIANDSPARAESFVRELLERCFGLGEQRSAILLRRHGEAGRYGGARSAVM